MSVEAMRQKKYSEKSDVWSFGITCIEILTQNQPCNSLEKMFFIPILNSILKFYQNRSRSGSSSSSIQCSDGSQT